MRGRELLQLIRSLSPRERDFVRAGFATEKNGAEWAALFDGIVRQKSFNKKLLSKASKIAERRISSILPAFSKYVVRMVGICHRDEKEEFELALNTAWKMVMRLQNGPAAAIIQDLYTRAAEVERFEVMLELHELTEVMTEPMELSGPGRDEVARLRENLSAYEALKSEFTRLKTSPVDEKSRILTAATQSGLLDSELSALSTRARILYYWAKTRHSFHLGDLRAAAHHQQEVIRMLTEYPWLKRERDFFLIKEHEPLIGFRFAARNNEQANALIFKVGNMPVKQEREELMKWQQLFPLRLSVALNEGNAEKGNASVADFQAILNAHGDVLPVRFVTKNLYWVAFFQLATGDFDGARKTSIQLLKEGKSSDFDLHYMPMTRILSVVLSYEMNEYEDLMWQEKTFRMTTAYQESDYYKLVLSLLRKLAQSKSELHRRTILEEYRQKATDMESDPLLAGYFNFFDIGNWIESKQRQCSMLEVFEIRALSGSNAENSSPKAQTQ